jgi:hypothetical protein
MECFGMHKLCSRDISLHHRKECLHGMPNWNMDRDSWVVILHKLHGRNIHGGHGEHEQWIMCRYVPSRAVQTDYHHMHTVSNGQVHECEQLPHSVHFLSARDMDRDNRGVCMHKLCCRDV